MLYIVLLSPVSIVIIMVSVSGLFFWDMVRIMTIPNKSFISPRKSTISRGIRMPMP